MAAQVNRHDRPIELVDTDGKFKTNIEQDLNLAHENCGVAAVSIMGVQSTGKSTLLNKCFSTEFQEMDEKNGMHQTTKGIWIAKCPSPNDGLKILVIDTEGSDSSERGRQGDNTFEKKTAVFALAMSNTVIFNMKCDNVNLYQGASRPLLETVFKVMLSKFSSPQQRNLVFVLRDKNKCPLDKLRSQLMDGLHEIWQKMSKPQDKMNAAVEDYFKIEVMAMPHYVFQRDEFDREVESLRGRIFRLVQHGKPERASGFTDLAEKNWKDIMENKILNLKLNRITVDRIFCHEIAEKQIRSFRADKSWLQMKGDVESGKIVQGFGKDVSSIVGEYLSEYNKESMGADKGEIDDRREQLTEKLLEVVEKTHLSLLESTRKKTLGNFQKEIVDNIKGGRKLVGIDRNKFITEFTDLLEDAHVQQANWNHIDEQLEKMKTELASYQEGALGIIETLEELQKNKTLICASAAKFGVETIALATILALAISAPGPGTAAGAGAASALHGAGVLAFQPLVSCKTFIEAWIKYKQTEEKIKESRRENPDVDNLYRQL